MAASVSPRRKVQVWVYADDESRTRQVLLLKNTEARGGGWQPVTGGVDDGEEVAAAAARELREETGIVGEPLALGHQFQFEGGRGGNSARYEETCFAIEVSDAEIGRPVRLDAREHVDSRWVGVEDAREMLEYDSNLKSLDLVSQRAPDFELPDETGKSRRLSSELQGGPILLVFYPGDFTPVCTKQLCSYRDGREEFARLGVRIWGISPDPVSKHAEFKKKFGFSFPLLSDEKKDVFARYGMISKLLFGTVSRGVVLVDSTLRIAHRSAEWTPLTFKTVDKLVDAIAGSSR